MKGWHDKDWSSTETEYETPIYLAEACIEALLKLAKYIPLTWVLDPCAGRGQWKKAIADKANYLHVDEMEITRGLDFYDYHKKYVNGDGQQYDIVVGNPPFTNITKWLRATCDVRPRLFAYILPATALSYSRMSMIQDLGYSLLRTYVIQNPKEWDLGYPHMFVVWAQTRHVGEINAVLPMLPGKQTTLEGF